MRDSIRNKCDLLTGNRDRIEKEFKFEFALMNIAAALVFTDANREADTERLKECRQILKKKVGIFSSFRDAVEPVVVSKMALMPDPERYIDEVKTVYDIISKKKFFDSAYLVQSAISICDAGRAAEAEEIAARFDELYKKMSKEHPFLTSSEDVIFAYLLVMSGKEVDTIIADMEECYSYLKKERKIKVGADEIQGLAEILALADGNMIEKCDKAVALFDAFAAHGMKYGKEYGEFASLGTLIDIGVDTDGLVEEVIETAEYLKESKGFGGWSLDKKQRLMFAAMLVGDSYNADGALTGSTAINSTVAMVVAEEVAIMLCVMAATTASNTATMNT